MSNHLIHETSPYLLQHAENPVDWFPWREQALAKSRLENKPIFLSIGYAACHWCHVMAHESFEDPRTAAILNEHFISIKVDREQRPDLDSIYMQATTALTGSGGWPMSVFLTPDLRPFYAGTYFPPVRRYNTPAFKDVLLSLARTWREKPDEIARLASQVEGHLHSAVSTPPGLDLTDQALEAASAKLLSAYDWQHGGWGRAPRFPQPLSIEFLLRRASGKASSEPQTLKAALHALKVMARGGMYDVVGGGFSRYSTDDLWLVPHFEKMLYDNAQLALAYLHAWQLARDPFYERVVVEILDFVLREMTHPNGGFYSSLDADSEGQEGKFYVWTRDELQSVISDDRLFELFAAAYGVTRQGNWEGRTVLRRALDDASLASRFRLDLTHVSASLDACHRKLLAARGARVRPATDDKVLTAWNGLMLRAFAEAGRFIAPSDKQAGYLNVAIRNADFLLRSLRPSGHLRRTWRNGATNQEVFLEDFAALILGLLQLYQSDFNTRWFTAAQELADEMIDRFSDGNQGFFDTPGDAEALLMRPKDLQDNATPSGNSLAAQALLELAAFSDKGQYRDLAENALRLVGDDARKYPTAFAGWLSAGDFAVNGNQQVAIVSATLDGLAPLLDVVRGQFRPNVVVAASSFPPPHSAPALLVDRPLQGGAPTAYVCRNFVCRLPVNTPQDLQQQL
jgi:hypothetical protein